MAIRIPIITAFDNKDLKKAGREIEQFSNKAVGQLKAIGIGAAIGAAYSVKAFADFENQMTQSVAIMGDISDDLKQEMESTAREVAKSTTFSAAQAAESYYFLASAGLDAASSMAALPQVAQFAQAGMFDMARATDLLTDAQSALGLTVRNDAQANLLNMAHVSDVLVRAATLANASVEQFSVSLTTKAGPAMRDTGVEIETGVAVLAAFADQGIKGELAGTNFGIVLRDLQTKARENKDAFEEAGIAVYDASGSYRNMADILEDLENATVGMSTEQKKATIATLGFSDKSMGALSALIGTSEQIRIYEAELRKANGTTQEIADKQLVSFTSQLSLLGSQLQDIAIEVGEQLIPVLSDMVNYLNTDEGRVKMQELAESLVAVAEAAAAVTVFLAEHVEYLDDLLIAVGAIKIAWGVLIGVIAMYNAATLGAVAVTHALKFAIASTGIGLLIIGLGTLVASFMSADSAAQNAIPGTEDYRLQLLALQNQAYNTANALATIIPASPTTMNRPINPRPGQVYTYMNYADGTDKPGVWWTQTWTGSEWTRPKRVTYQAPVRSSGGGASAPRLTETIVDPMKEALERLKEVVKQNVVNIAETFTGAFDLTRLSRRDGILKGASQMLARMRAFAKELRKLANLGIHPELLDQVIQLGPEQGLELARELTSGDGMIVSGLNEVYEQVRELGIATGARIARTEAQVNYTINVNAGIGDRRTIGAAVVEAIQTWERANGQSWRS